MIDIRKLKELVRLMVNNELTELDLRDNEEQVTLRRHTTAQMPQVMAPAAQTMYAAPAAHSAPGHAAHHTAGGAPKGEDEDDGLQRIESPMVGTFYAASSPDAPPFVSVGTSIGPDTNVCIIEAMKIFNEIKAECSGSIAKVLVQNGEPVEFGQPLFLVNPA